MSKSDYDITFEEEEFQLNETIKALEEVIADIKRNMPSVSLYAVASSWEERDNLLYDKRRKVNSLAQVDAYKQLIPSPYYARMDLIVDGGRLTMHIGKKEFSANGRVVYDWRAPLASKYRGRETEFTYGGTQHRLALKRDFDISNSTLHYYSDKYVLGTDENKDGITDPFLLRLLIEKKGKHKLTDIIRTIQANQGTIIEFDTNKGFIVQGCAGSGKTMILLHRLSYIKYNHPKLRLETVKIITPNTDFNKHISSLSKDLKLNDIGMFSVEDYYLDILQKYERQNQRQQELNYKRRYAFDLMTKEEQSKFSIPKYNERYAAVKATPEHHHQEFINYVYSDTFKELCIQAYTNYINNIESVIGFGDCIEICKKYGYAHSFRKDTSTNLDKYIEYITEAFRANTIRVRNEKYNDLLSRQEVLECKTTRLPNDRESAAELETVEHKIQGYKSSMLLNEEDEVPILERAASLLAYRSVYNATINRQLCQAAANFNVDISYTADSIKVKKCYSRPT